MYKNLAYGIVLIPPSPTTSGVTLGLQSGNVTRFPDSDTDTPYFCTICPSDADPTPANAEIVKITSDNTGTDQITIIRAQRGSSARSIQVGDRVFLGIYKEDLDVLSNGWLEANETWTYATANTFTINGDKTAKYQKGMKLKLVQSSTTKYFIVTNVSYSSPNTTITVAVTTDYTIANSAITSNYYSLIESPLGFPASFAFTPNITGSGGTLGTFAQDITGARFWVVGKICHFWMYTRITNLGSWSGTLYIDLPLPGNNSNNSDKVTMPLFLTAQGSNPVTAARGIFQTINSTLGGFKSSVNSSLLAWAGVSANDTIFGEGFYEI